MKNPLFNQAFTFAPSPMFVLAADGSVHLVNRAACEMFGCTEEEFYQHDHEACASAAAHAECRAAQARLLAGETEIEEHQYVLKFPHRERLFVNILSCIARGPDGTPLGFVCEVRSTVEEERVVQQLRESEHRYRVLVETSRDLICSFDPEGRWMFVNRVVSDLLGYEPREMIGRLMSDFQSPEHAERDRAYRESELGAGHRHLRYETEFQRRHGTAVGLLFNLIVNRDSEDKVLGVSGSAVDITERRASEEALRKSEERFQIVAAATRDVVWDWDVATGQIWWNENLERCFGRPAGEPGLTIDAWRKRVHPEDAERVSKGIDQAVERGDKFWSDEYRFQRADGTFAHVYDRGSVVRDGAGKAVRMLGAMSDLSEHVQLEEELRQAQKLELVSQLAAGVGHDFNNLLTIISGHTDLLQRSAGLPDAAGESLHQIASAAGRAANLTRQLLTFGRRQLMQPRKLNFNEVIGTAASLLTHLIPPPLRVVTRLAAEPIWTEADEGMVEHIVTSLAFNARDAMRQNGTITLRTSVQRISAEEAKGERQAGEYAVLSVSDEGLGMSAEAMARVFEPFFSTQGANTAHGLGLAPVYGIVRQHHGWIDVESTPGKGSTFHVYLPRTTPETEEDAHADEENLELRTRGTILLVEDEAALRGLAAYVLRDEGYHVLEAGTGPEALELWKVHGSGIDLLFTDVLMPGGMSGKDLADQLLRAHPDLPVVFSSGYSRDIVSKGSVLPPGIQFLQKPYVPDQLTKIIRDTLVRSATHGRVVRFWPAD